MNNSRSFQLYLGLLVLLNLFAHLDEHFFIVFITGGICLVWRTLYYFQKIKLPNYIVKSLLVLLSFLIIFQLYGTLLGIEASTALLISAVSLKLIDNSKYRDSMILIFLNFLLILAKTLVSQTLLMTLHMSLNLILIIGLLLHLHQSKNMKFNLMALVKAGLKLSLQISPLLILLFFVFPRFSVGFVNIHSKNKATSGFSGELNPGEVANLIKSKAPAFYTKLSSPVRLSQRYWRGQVLTEYKGFHWFLDKRSRSSKKNLKNTKPTSKGIEQLIILKPKYNKWLFTLDNPTQILFSDKRKQIQSRLNLETKIYKIKHNNGQNITYNAISSPNLAIKQKNIDKNKYLQTELNTDKAFQLLVDKINVIHHTNLEKAQLLLRYFSSNFKYTSSPNPSKNLNDFLFNSKQGFCEHFAAAYATILRHAKVPTRVVVGFHGGIKNNFSQFLVIKDSDAHAWVEVWDQGLWHRIDPTSVVAPLRLELGGDQYHSFTEEEIKRIGNAEQLLNKYRSSLFYNTFGLAELYYENISIQWQNFLVNYNQTEQLNFLESLGLKNLKPKHLAMASICLIFLFYLSLILKKKLSVEKVTTEFIYYKGVLSELEKLNITKKLSEPPRSFLRRAHQELIDNNTPLQAKLVQDFLEIYQPYVFSSKQSPQDLVDLKTILTKIKSPKS
jgi:protein-glutamine gamma-glutamyltransferase